MSDQAHDWTDDRIDELSEKMRKQYQEAAKNMQAKLDTWLEDYDRRRKVWEDDVSSGRRTKAEYDAWRKDMASDKSWQQEMIDTLSYDAMNTDRLAIDAINDELPRIYAENANFTAYTIDKGIGMNTGFTLVDQDTVRRLMMDNPDIVPAYRIDQPKDYVWNQQKFNSAITQGILQGESIPDISKRVESVIGMDKSAATRSARTACTAAESMGRQSSYKRAQDLGIGLRQRWMATLDLRTRHTHRLLDKQTVQVGQKFCPKGYGEKYALRFPADPQGLAEMIFNCRCTTIAVLDDDDYEDDERWSRLPDGMTYEEWKGENKPNTNNTSGNVYRFVNTSNPVWSQLGSVKVEDIASKVDSMLAHSSGTAAKLWQKYEDRIRMVDPSHSGGAFYRHSDGGVHMNVQRSLDDIGGKGALSTWFHEFGHNIDYLAGNGQKAFTTFYDSGKFAESLKQEVKEYIKARQTELNKMLRERDLKRLLDAGAIKTDKPWRVDFYHKTLEHIADTKYLEEQGWNSKFLKMTPQERSERIWEDALRDLRISGKSIPIQNVRDMIGNEITKDGQSTQIALGDIFEGATKGSCKDTYGHGKKYWQPTYWNADGDALAKEAFAEFFSAECIYSERPEILKTMIERLPKSYEVYKEIVSVMTND